MHNSCLTTESELLSALNTVLTKDFAVFACADDFELVAKAKISTTPKSATTAQRMWKIYRKLQDEFFHVQLSIFQTGSPAHSLNALVVDYSSLSSKCYVCPAFSEMVSLSIKERVALFSLSISK